MYRRLFKRKFLATATGLALLLVTFASCKKYLDVEPISSFGPDYVFSNTTNAEKAVLGVYERMTGDNGYGIRLTMYYPYDDDLMMGQGGTPYPDNERRDIAHYQVTPNNTQLYKPFAQLYEGVERANLCIYYIPKMDMYNNGAEAEKAKLRQLYGEALTLRAQFYFELIRNWGDVPAHFLPSAVDENLSKGKTDRDSIYNVILDDLKTAEDLVPWRSTVGTSERISQGAVRALRARIALHAGGYSLRRSRQMERRSDYLNFYQIAREETLAVMNSGQHNLNPSFESLWKDYVAGLKQEPNGEIIWDVAMGGGNGTTDSKLGYYNGPRVNNKGNSALTILPTYFYMFDPNDTRRDVTCVPYNVNATGDEVTTRVGRNLAIMVDGKYRRDWIPGALSSSAQYFGVNWPLLRYSDVLLMFAEADNEINNGPSAQAKAAFEQVRLRAFGGDASKIGTTPSDKAAFFDALVKERALELGDEGIRKYDLIRWNMLAQKLTETKATLTAMGNREAPYDQLPEYMFYKTDEPVMIWANSFYEPSGTSAPAGYSRIEWVRSSITNNIVRFYIDGFEANHNELLPLPQALLDANPNLTQDYGY